MKPSLRVKVLILLGYVVLCTAWLVSGEQLAEPRESAEPGLTEAGLD